MLPATCSDRAIEQREILSRPTPSNTSVTETLLHKSPQADCLQIASFNKMISEGPESGFEKKHTWQCVGHVQALENASEKKAGKILLQRFSI